MKTETWYFGDPRYIMKREIYDRVWGDQHEFEVGEFKIGDRQDLDFTFAVASTAYGDGTYPTTVPGKSVDVDSGTLALVHESLFDESKIDDSMIFFKSSVQPSLGSTGGYFTIRYSEEGVDGLSYILCNTAEEDEDEEDDYYFDEDKDE